MLATYPIAAAATRYRVAAYFDSLREHGIDCDLRSFYDDREFAALYSGGIVRNAHSTLNGLGRLLGVGLNASSYDGALIQREAAPVGPAVLEGFLGARGVPLIFDFDDAVWLSQHERSVYPRLARLLRPEKALRLIDCASLVIAGSQALARKAREHNDNVVVLPTTVPEATWRPLPERSPGDFLSDVPIVGWVGTHSTAPQLELAFRALERVAERGLRFQVRVVGAGRGMPSTSMSIESRPWILEREVEDFQTMDIGLAPMFDDAWSAGKCGFKQVQYLAAGIPMVSSPIGGAKELLIGERDALFATTLEEWVGQLTRLLTDAALRRKLVSAGLEKFRRELSLEAQSAAFVAAIARSLKRP